MHGLFLVSAAVISVSGPATFMGTDLQSVSAPQLIKMLEAQGAKQIVRRKPELSAAETTGDVSKDRWTLKLKKLAHSAEWLGDEFEVRLSPPPRYPEYKDVRVSWCPATDAVSSVNVSYKVSVGSIDNYARITAGLTKEIGRKPDEIVRSEDGSMTTVWRLASTTMVVAIWSAPDAPILVSYGGGTDAVRCHLQFSAAKAQAEETDQAEEMETPKR